MVEEVNIYINIMVRIIREDHYIQVDLVVHLQQYLQIQLVYMNFNMERPQLDLLYQWPVLY